jgi:hypothetical protein
MSTTNLPTAEALGGPEVRQFSIFLRNKVGALLEVVKLLQEHNVMVLALSVLDSSETAIGRIITSDPDRARLLFDEQAIPYSECNVLLVELQEGAVDLGHVLAALLMAEVNIFFSYPMLTRPRGRAVLVFHVDDADCARSVLQGEDFILLNQADISR